MENLTKENFWNEMQGIYPNAIEKFCKWIDQYKENNNWNKLFNGCLTIRDYSITTGSNTYWSMSPKFHDLPIAFQVGIFNQYCAEQEMDIQEYQSMQSSIIERFLRSQNE